MENKLMLTSGPLHMLFFLPGALFPYSTLLSLASFSLPFGLGSNASCTRKPSLTQSLGEDPLLVPRAPRCLI